MRVPILKTIQEEPDETLATAAEYLVLAPGFVFVLATGDVCQPHGPVRLFAPEPAGAINSGNQPSMWRS